MSQVISVGIILKAKNFNESGRLYTIFSKELGKISAVASGVRKITSRRSGNLDLLNEVKFSLARSKSIPIITEAQVLNSFDEIKKSLTKVSKAYSFIEIVDKFVQDEEVNEQAYYHLSNALKELNKNDSEIISPYFELKLLGMLGFAPVLEFCTSCFRNLDVDWGGYKFNFSAGGLVCPSCLASGVSVNLEDINTLTILKNYYFKEIKENNEEKRFKETVKDLIRTYLESVSGSRIKSEVLLKPLKQNLEYSKDYF